MFQSLLHQHHKYSCMYQPSTFLKSILPPLIFFSENNNFKTFFSMFQSLLHRHHKYSRMYQPSTFLTSFTPPVFMDDDDNSQSYEGSVTSATEPWHDDDDPLSVSHKNSSRGELVEESRIQMRIRKAWTKFIYFIQKV